MSSNNVPQLNIILILYSYIIAYIRVRFGIFDELADLQSQVCDIMTLFENLHGSVKRGRSLAEE